MTTSIIVYLNRRIKWLPQLSYMRKYIFYDEVNVVNFPMNWLYYQCRIVICRERKRDCRQGWYSCLYKTWQSEVWYRVCWERIQKALPCAANYPCPLPAAIWLQCKDVVDYHAMQDITYIILCFLYRKIQLLGNTWVIHMMTRLLLYPALIKYLLDVQIVLKEHRDKI